MHTFINTYTYIHACLPIYIPKGMHKYNIYTYICLQYVFLCAYIHIIYIDACVYMYTYAYIYTCEYIIHSYMHTSMHIKICISAYINTYMYTFI